MMQDTKFKHRLVGSIALALGAGCTINAVPNPAPEAPPGDTGATAGDSPEPTGCGGPATGGAGASCAKGGRAPADDGEAGSGGSDSEPGDAPEPDAGVPNVPPAQGYLGFGFDSEFQRKLARCAAGTVASTPIDATTTYVRMGIEARATLEGLARRRSVGIGIPGLIGLSTDSGKATQVFDASRDVMVVVGYEYHDHSIELQNDGQLRWLVEQGTPTFVSRCGDAVYARETFGAELVLAIVVHTESSERRSDVERSLGIALQYGAIQIGAGRGIAESVVGVIGEFDSTVRFAQVGGSRDHLAGTSAASGGLRLGGCNDQDRCVEALASFLEATIAPEVTSDLRGHPAVVDRETAPWVEFGATSLPDDAGVDSLGSWQALARDLEETWACQEYTRYLLERDLLSTKHQDLVREIGEVCELGSALLGEVFDACRSREPDEQKDCLADLRLDVEAAGYAQIDAAQLAALLMLDRKLGEARRIAFALRTQSVGTECLRGYVGLDEALEGSWTRPFGFALGEENGYCGLWAATRDDADVLGGEPLLAMDFSGPPNECLASGRRLLPSIPSDSDLMSTPFYLNMERTPCTLGFEMLDPEWAFDVRAAGACGDGTALSVTTGYPVVLTLPPSSQTCTLEFRVRLLDDVVAANLGLP
jgi:hypothetical protein